jgi:alcohol dehydrogenase class IV
MLSQAFGGGPGAAALHRWSRAAGLPGLAELGLRAEDHATVVQAALAASSMKANPVVLTEGQLTGVLVSAA